ncbi:MAG TPA: hypothetical protein VK178_01695, partial [Opitutaceae bacterium]|nr:hypothetical protein [Opitutaceae bacterium]
MNTSTPTRPLAAIGVIAATYVFFLLFAEFALLHLMEARAADATALRLGLAWLGGGGVLGSLLAAFTPSHSALSEWWGGLHARHARPAPTGGREA